MDAREVQFVHAARRELRLKLTGEVTRASKDYDAGCVCIEAVDRSQLLRVIDPVENRLQRVAVESARGMERQRGRFIQHHERAVFVQHSNRRVDIRLRRGRHSMQIPLAGPYTMFRSHSLAVCIEEQALGETLVPIVGRQLWEDIS